MASGSFTSADYSKRQRALPVPRATADMKTFTPDSSIASDVIPSANYGERAKGRQPDMIVLHYTGMPDVEGAIAQLCTAGTEVSAHYIVLEDGRIVQCVPEAKRAWHAGVSPLGGRGRHQFLLDRDRDHQSRPRLGLPGLSAATDRRRDRAVPRHHASPQGAVASRARPFRCRAFAQEGPGREIPVAFAGQFRRRALGAAGADRARRDAKARQHLRRCRQHADRVGPIRLRHPAHGKYDGPTMEVVTAFQRHFRPERVDGVADHSTMSTLHALLASLPEEATAPVVPAK